jgi:hypothetical protein
MVRRIAAVPLWLASIWLANALVADVTGLSENAGAVLGVLTAAMVFVVSAQAHPCRVRATRAAWSPGNVERLHVR